MITEKTYKALKIIQKHPGITASGFANLMWPDAEGHKRVKNGGHGAQRGKGMWLAAGSYLAKLHKRKLLTYSNSQCFSHELSAKGEGEVLIYEDLK